MAWYQASRSRNCTGSEARHRGLWGRQGKVLFVLARLLNSLVSGLPNESHSLVTRLWRRGQQRKAPNEALGSQGICTWHSAGDWGCDGISNKGHGSPRPRRAHHLRACPSTSTLSLVMPLLLTGNVASDPFPPKILGTNQLKFSRHPCATLTSENGCEGASASYYYPSLPRCQALF